MDGGDAGRQQASIPVAPILPRWTADAAIGQVVRHFAPRLLKRLEDDPDELERLQTVSYSKAVFGLGFAFMQRSAGLPPALHNKYWIEDHTVRRGRYRLTSQWHTKHRLPFLRYLTEGRAVRAEPAPADADAFGFAEEAVPFVVAARAKAAPGTIGHAHHIGDAQNALVRTVLSRVAPVPISDVDWPDILAEFGGRCAYCGGYGPLTRDHVVPINRTALGEHCLGNLVPSCGPCNSAKGGSAVETFLADRPERLAAIHAHRRRHGYRPIGENATVRAVLERGTAELAALAERLAREVRAAAAGKAADGSSR